MSSGVGEVTRWLPRTSRSAAEQLVAVGAELVGEREQQVLDRQVVVAEVAPEPVGRLEAVAGGPTERRLLAAHRARQPAPQASARRAATSSGDDPDPGQHRPGDRVGVGEHRRQQVGRA